MCGILAELNIEFCDTTPVLREMGDAAAYLEFDGHLTPAANEAVARALVARWPDLVSKK